MNEPRLPLAATLAGLPPEWPEQVWPSVQERARRSGQKVVVLDDDPTGSQVVRDIPVLTEWSIAALEAELRTDYPAFYILTNSRSLPVEQAKTLNAEIGRNLALASGRTARPIVLVSRSDSTLRGHFPGEVQALADSAGIDFDAWLIIPTLPSAGRVTIGNIHYVAEEDWLVPAGQSQYARDASFGYQASNLKAWVEEKTSGRVLAGRVQSISLEDLRRGGPEQAARRLLALPHGSTCIINAVTRGDLDVLARGLLEAEDQGRRFLYRTGPTFVPARIGQGPYDLLDPRRLQLPSRAGGLVIVGSYVPRSSGQVQHLLETGGVEGIEIRVERILDPLGREEEIERAAARAGQALSRGLDTLIYTSRKLVTGADNLLIGRQVSEALVAVLHAIQTRPRYLLAKGGVTSSDLATRGLGIRRAIVAGQIIPGVSVWQCGPESRWPGLAYLVFPGNVGGPESLAEVVQKLKVENETQRFSSRGPSGSIDNI